jgi:hypothetical protein
MPRRPDNDKAREHYVGARFGDEECRELDRKRGPKTRSEYLRHAVEIAPPEAG